MISPSYQMPGLQPIVLGKLTSAEKVARTAAPVTLSFLEEALCVDTA
ncbi:hypothetical protein [Trichococcus alkaliphilus]|nr:hypothetical protein [Trichococcus alkaliphilus]